MIYQLVSLLGAFFILTAYGFSQAGRLTPTDTVYAVLNCVGAVLLTWVAVVDRRAGFILLESCWAILSLLPLVRHRAVGRSGP